GQCRATNYLALIKQGLKNAGLEHIPTIAIALGEVYQNKQEGFRLPVFKILNVVIHSFFFGDFLNQIFSATVVREKEKGKSRQLFDFYMDEARKIVLENKPEKFFKLLENTVSDFNSLEIEDKKLEKVGLIGEIFVKYNSYGQAHITDWLREQGIEVEMPPMRDFFMQAFINQVVNRENGMNRINRLMLKLFPLFYRILNNRLKKFEKIAQQSRFNIPHENIFEIAEHAKKIIDLANQFGEGWLLAGEVAGFAQRGVSRIVCVQPFGCIANHIVAKGIERRLKQFYPEMNLLYLDIDGGLAEVNLHNRLEFLLT
ncbi:MAG: hypothetical protein LBF90_05485, partial [Prevotellaceae bacterium]|nr:hypothetical protein [Prevotellaceae bacterium]